MDESSSRPERGRPWKKGRLLGQKAPLKVSEVWAIRVRPQLTDRARDLALLDLAIDSKLRSRDLVGLRVRDIFHGDHIAPRAVVMQRKTGRPVQLEITEPTRRAVSNRVTRAGLRADDILFPSRCRWTEHISTRQHARIVKSWIREIGLDPTAYGTHSHGTGIVRPERRTGAEAPVEVS